MLGAEMLIVNLWWELPEAKAPDTYEQAATVQQMLDWNTAEQWHQDAVLWEQVMGEEEDE